MARGLTVSKLLLFARALAYVKPYHVLHDTDYRRN